MTDNEEIAILGGAAGVDLTVARDIVVGDQGPCATSREPWLRLSSIEDFLPGVWIEMRYATSLYDDPVRPILRFWMQGGAYKDVLAPAPCEGVGVWIGRAPPNLSEVWVSPTDNVGRFDFQILSIGPTPLRTALRKAFASPKRMFFSLSARLVGLHDEADLNLRWALGREKLSAYPNWRSQRSERPDSAIDAPRSDWEKSPVATVVLDVEGASIDAINSSCRALTPQVYPHWRVLLKGSAPQANKWLGDDRFTRIETKDFDVSRDLVCVLRAGDEILPHGIACIVEHFARNPSETIAYADHSEIGSDGASAPCYKPGWSPTLNSFTQYVGRAALFRGAMLGRGGDLLSKSPDDLLAELLASTSKDSVGRVARVLFHFPRSENNEAPRAALTPTKLPEPLPRVTVVVPTRDRSDLLRPCLETLSALTSFPNLEVLVVDNDSVEPTTHRLLQELPERDRRITVLPAPGPFNFSAICNRAAQSAGGDFLVFLNNDTTIVSPGWVESMLEFASRPDVGAVGAKLLFPDFSVQHVGVALGMGGVAGHFGADLHQNDPGWRGVNLYPHEVAAVTGACLMVERRKFQAVGGFDEINLPIELNDIDLCLRLTKMGWRCICDSRAALVHHQSASRGGATFRLQKTYAAERAYFIDKWRATIRNDPYFHPALSLYAHTPALG